MRKSQGVQLTRGGGGVQMHPQRIGHGPAGVLVRQPPFTVAHLLLFWGYALPHAAQCHAAPHAACRRHRTPIFAILQYANPMVCCLLSFALLLFCALLLTLVPQRQHKPLSLPKTGQVTAPTESPPATPPPESAGPAQRTRPEEESTTPAAATQPTEPTRPAPPADPTEACLLDQATDCPFACPATLPFSCLSSRIRWHTPLPRITCCFRCCLQYWYSVLGLHSTVEHWRKVIPTVYTPRKKTPIHPCIHNRDPTSVLIGSDGSCCVSDFQSADNYVQEYRTGIACGTPPLCFLDKLQHPINLRYAGDGRFPGTIPQFLRLLEHPKVNMIFARNPVYYRGDCVTAHPKLSAYPIGVINSTAWARQLNSYTRPLQDRPKLILCGAIKWYHIRAKPLSVLKRLRFNCSKALSPEAYFQEMVRSKFVASPRGKGDSNFRDFEALTAGSIPIVQDIPSLRSLWAGMPVLRIKWWDTLTPGLLESVWKDYTEQARQLKLTVEKAYWPYWVHKTLEHAVRRDFMGNATPYPAAQGGCRPENYGEWIQAQTPRACADPANESVGCDLINLNQQRC